MKQRSYTLSLRQFWVWNANIFRVFIDLSPWAIFCWTELWGLVYSLGLYIVNQSWYYNWLWIKEALAEASSLLFSEQIKPIFSISSAAFSGNRSSAGEFADASTCKESPLASDPPGQSHHLEIPLQMLALPQRIFWFTSCPSFLSQPGKFYLFQTFIMSYL